MKTWKFTVTGLALVAALGCAPGRMADLRDSGRLGIGLGPGLSVDAKLGDLTHPALGLFGASAMWGWESREIEGFWYEGEVSDPFAIYWYRRVAHPWKCALISSGWRGTWDLDGGGAYGRILGPASILEAQPEDLKRAMDVTHFAQQALDAVAKNREIIVLPSAWRLLWGFDRLFPTLGSRLIAWRYQRGKAEFLARAATETEDGAT